MEPTLAEIRMFAGNFAPRGWALCEGQLLPISDNQALFSLLGTIYGGDGRTTFALPDFRGRCPISPGNGPGLPGYNVGQKVGAATTSLTVSNLPPHTHAATTTAQANALPSQGDSAVPAGRTWAGSAAGDNDYATPAGTTPLVAGAVAATTTVSNTGSGTSFNEMQPSIAINYIIALQGVFPSRN